jgi:predicted CopG family antitoxin
MSTKTIAVETSVYERLARAKRPSESFTKAIARILDATTEHTCSAAVREARAIWSSSDAGPEADLMERIVRQTRKDTDWTVERPE